MLNIYRTDYQGKTAEIAEFEKGCWVYLTNPSEQEKQRVIDELQIDLSFLQDALDEEETARVEKDGNQLMLFVEIPFAKRVGEKEVYSTVPLGILVLENYFVTVCLKETAILDDFVQGKIKNFHTYMRTRFVLQILFHTSLGYLQYLKKINRQKEALEKSLRLSMKNNEILAMLELEKSLVYFSTALHTNKVLMERLMSGSYLKMYSDDQDLLEEVMIEINQAIKVTEIYTAIVGSMMNAFGSVISNNVNHVVKLLTAITIIITLPMLIGTYYGMNVPLPFQEDPHAFALIMIASVAITILTTLLFWRKKYL